ncbi:MAG: extracellular matrix regulator RemB [Oscillospiraceae bacterium]
MYLYLGNDAVAEDRDIVGIFDLDNASWSVHTRKFLSAAEKNKKLWNAAEDIPKSFVVCTDETVILTQPNTAILVRRLNDQEKWNG